MDLGALVNQFGLPIGLLFYFIWRDYQTAKEHKADMRDIAIKSVQAIDKGTDAIEQNTKVIETNNTALSDNSDILNIVKGVLSARGGGHYGRSSN